VAVAAGVSVQPGSCSRGDRTAAFQVRIEGNPGHLPRLPLPRHRSAFPSLGGPVANGQNRVALCSWKEGWEQPYLGGDGDPVDGPCSQPGSPNWVSLQGGEGEGGEKKEKGIKNFFPIPFEMKECTSKSYFSQGRFSAWLLLLQPLASACAVPLPPRCGRFLPFVSCRACVCSVGSPTPLAMPGRSTAWHGWAGERSLPFPGARVWTSWGRGVPALSRTARPAPAP